MAEQSVWKGNPSQVTNLGVFILCALTFFLVIPIFIAIWRWLKTHFDNYELTTERILHSVGVFSRETDTLELYRIKDLQVEQPFFLRMFGLCNIVMHTSDQTNPTFTLYAVPFGSGLSDKVRALVEARRDAKHVREVDFGAGEVL